MPLFHYNAMNDTGRTLKGKLTSHSELELEKKLHALGLSMISCKEISDKSVSNKRNVSIGELIIICIQLEQLERAGVPLLDALEDLQNTADSTAVKNLMGDIYESVKQGNMLSAAMAKHPEVFDQVFTNLVAAGEKTGNLYSIFEHLALHLKWVSGIQSQIKKATYYPMFLALLMSGVVALMMLYVIPQLTTFLTSQNIALPVYTIALINTSAFVQDYWPALLALPIVLYATVRVMRVQSESFAAAYDNFLLNLPVLGTLITKFEMARFCRFFSLTYRSGIGILECLDISANVIGNRVIKESIFFTRSAVSEGSSLTEAMRSTNQFPGLVLRMINIGEESGNLDSTLDNVNFFYDREVNESVQRLLGMIQPALTIIMGLMMLWISISVFGPLYRNLAKIAG